MKRKRMYVMFVAMCCMLFMLAGCGKEAPVDGTRLVSNVGTDKITVGEFNAVLRYQQASYYAYQQQMIAQYEQMAKQGMQFDIPDELFDAPATEDTKSSEEDRMFIPEPVKAKTTGDLLINQCLTSMVEYRIVGQHASEYKQKLSEDDKKAIEKAASAYCDKNADILKQGGVEKKDVIRYLEDFTLYQKMLHKIRDVEPKISKKDLRLMDCSVIMFSDGEKKDAEKSAKKVLENLKKREDLATLNMSTVIGDYPNATATDYTLSVNREEAGYGIAPDVLKKISQLKAGELYPEVVPDDSGHYYIFRMTNPKNTEKKAEFKETLIESEKDKVYKKTVSAWVKGTKIVYHKDGLALVSVTDKSIYKFAEKEESTEANTQTSDSDVINVTDTGTEKVSEESSETVPKEESASETQKKKEK